MMTKILLMGAKESLKIEIMAKSYESTKDGFRQSEVARVLKKSNPDYHYSLTITCFIKVELCGASASL